MSKGGGVEKVGPYKLGAVLGKGGFGTVYSSLDEERGGFYAIKQINLSKIPKDQLDGIMQEIDLLKNLNHTNIVKYVQYIKTKDSLYIVLELVENGSLASIVKKFGKFPENLVCVYITQVLEGLVYLHEQGVVHRDIKGANILTTKEGIIKLADFGVATKFDDANAQAVVGTPYWMAPEIIELNGSTTASDIWSVGCTVIELLTGAPPYYDLGPMPALFRIVQDDYPPLPDGVSPSLKDWLMQCFQKDPVLRISAEKLLKHKWIKTAKRKQTTVETPAEGVEEILKYKTKLEETSKKIQSKPPPPILKEPIQSKQPVLLPPPEEDDGDDWGDDFTPGSIKLKPKSQPGSSSSSSSSKKEHKPSPLKLATTHSPPPPKEQKPNKEAPPLKLALANNNNKQQQQANANNNKKPAPKKKVEEEEEDNWDDDFGSPAPASSSSSKAPLANLKGLLKGDDLDDDDWGDGASPPAKPLALKKPVMPEIAALKQGEGLGSYKEENDEDDWGDLEGGIDNAIKKSGAGAGKDSTWNLVARIQNKKNATINESRGDVFGDEFDDEFDEDEFDLEEAAQKDAWGKMSEEITKLMGKLQLSQAEEIILSAAQELVTLFKENPDHKVHVIRNIGVIPIMEMLEGSNARVLQSILQVVNQTIENNIEIKENLCLVGGIPAIMKFSGRDYSLAIRLEAANFISQMCSTSTVTLQMFIACRGLPTLVDILSTPYAESKTLVWMAVDAICSVFELQSTTPKNDFCRLFSKCGLLPVLASVMKLTAEDADASAKGYPSKIANLFLIFSSADGVVKLAMSQPDVLGLLFEPLDRDRLPPAVLVKVLKALKQLSMDHNTLSNLQRAGTIRRLVRTLARREGPSVTEMHNHTLNAIYNLCKLDQERQYIAAQEGVVPHLMYIIVSKSPLRQFALPVLCDLAHVKRARGELWKNKTVEFYLDLLSDKYWLSNALDSLSTWLMDEKERVEKIVAHSAQIAKIVNAFEMAEFTTFANLMDPLLHIVTASEKVNVGLGTSKIFVPVLLDRMTHTKAEVRVSLLRILTSLYKSHPNPKKMIGEFRLYPVVESLTKDKIVLVQKLASQLLVAFNTNTVL